MTDVIVSADDAYLSMGGGVSALSYAITIDWSQKDEFTVEKSINSIIKKSLNVLSVLGLKSIAFPVIATRTARYSLIEHTCFRIP